jgi:FKBP-type peptidyl-prolyl cis-trans isomerase (trigger factor)
MLETTSKKLEGNNVEVTVIISAAEVDKQISAEYKEAGKSRIPGFRPGKAPRNILDNYFGGKEYFLAKATDELVRDTAPIAVDDQGYVALSAPEFKEFDIAEAGKDFEYGFSLEVTPELELSSYEPVKIELPSAEPTAEEIQTQLDALLEYYVTEDENGERVVPELTDAWVKESLEFESVDELKTRVSDSILQQKEQEIPAIREYRSSNELAERLVGEVPESMVRQTEQDNYRDLFQNLQNQRVTLDAYLEAAGLTSETFRENMHEQAHHSAAIALALDALGKNLGLEASDDEVKEEFVKSGAKDPEQLFENWKANGRISEVRQGLVRIKASKHVNDTAEIFEPGSLHPVEETEAEQPEAEKPVKKKTTKKTADGDKPKTTKAKTDTDKSDEGKPKKADTKKKTTAMSESAKVDSNNTDIPENTTEGQ